MQEATTAVDPGGWSDHATSWAIAQRLAPTLDQRSSPELDIDFDRGPGGRGRGPAA